MSVITRLREVLTERPDEWWWFKEHVDKEDVVALLDSHQGLVDALERLLHAVDVWRVATPKRENSGFAADIDEKSDAAEDALERAKELEGGTG